MKNNIKEEVVVEEVPAVQQREQQYDQQIKCFLAIIPPQLQIKTYQVKMRLNQNKQSEFFRVVYNLYSKSNKKHILGFKEMPIKNEATIPGASLASTIKVQ